MFSHLSSNLFAVPTEKDTQDHINRFWFSLSFLSLQLREDTSIRGRGREDAQTQASLCSMYMQTLMRASERVSNYTKRAESQSPLALHARACKHFPRLDLLEPAWTGGGELCKRPERQTHLSSRDDLHCMSSSRNCGWRERSNAASDTLVGPVRVVPARRSRLRAAHAPPLSGRAAGAVGLRSCRNASCTSIWSPRWGGAGMGSFINTAQHWRPEIACGLSWPRAAHAARGPGAWRIRT